MSLIVYGNYFARTKLCGSFEPPVISPEDFSAFGAGTLPADFTRPALPAATGRV
jgi:hypothetical protein